MCCTCKPKTCCCCVSIPVGTHIIGALDILGCVATIIQIIIAGIKGRLDLIFFNGSHLYTIIPTFFLVRFFRALFYIIMIPQRQVEKRRDWYFKVRFITFFVAIVISIIDLIIDAVIANKDKEKDDGTDSNENKRRKAGPIFYIIYGIISTLIAALFDLYFTMIVRQYRNMLRKDLKAAETAPANNMNMPAPNMYAPHTLQQ